MKLTESKIQCGICDAWSRVSEMSGHQWAHVLNSDLQVTVWRYGQVLILSHLQAVIPSDILTT